MAYVITQNCCNDASCVAVCPVGCIHPRPDEPDFGAAEMLYVDPATCIDCGACADACPVDAIYPGNALPLTAKPFRDVNADYYRDRSEAPRFARTSPPRPLVTSRNPLRVAIVGTGPAGLYCAKELLHHTGVEVDMYERLPDPNGLIRYGVAPDHPATKAVAGQFRFHGDKKRRLRLHLGVEIGVDLHHADLLTRHQAVIYAHGAFHPRRSEIPGAELAGSIPAAAFVGWYNSHPDHRGLTPPLSGRRAAIIGNGNVALDIARMLVTDPAELERTDISRDALHALRDSTVDEVVIFGRRGPEHAAFTVPELHGLDRLRGVDIVVDPDDIPSPDGADGRVRAKLQLLSELAARTDTGARKRIVLRFNRTPIRVLGRGQVAGLEVSADGSTEQIDTGLVVHAIGFRGRPIPDVPFDADAHTIPNVEGRVVDPTTGDVQTGVYVSGWIKRGPSGVIGTNRTCAEHTVGSLLDDHATGLLTGPDRRTRNSFRGLRRAGGALRIGRSAPAHIG